MHCLDTDIIVDFLRGKDSAIKTMQKHAQGLSVTWLSMCELYKGAYLSDNPEAGIALISGFLKNVNILGMDERAARIYGSNYAELKRQGKLKQEFDMMIAAICISHERTLLTRNVKDYTAIPGLTMEE